MAPASAPATVVLVVVHRMREVVSATVFLAGFAGGLLGQEAARLWACAHRRAATSAATSGQPVSVSDSWKCRFGWFNADGLGLGSVRASMAAGWLSALSSR